MGVVTERMLNNKLLALHTAYLAKVISTNGSTAKIQPLGLTKAYGSAAQKQSPLSNVPIATHKIGSDTIEIIADVTVEVEKDGDTIKDVTVKKSKKTIEIPKLLPIAADDIVVCICCERNITEAKKGNNALPPAGHHSMSDSVIVGVLQRGG